MHEDMYICMYIYCSLSFSYLILLNATPTELSVNKSTDFPQVE